LFIISGSLKQWSDCVLVQVFLSLVCSCRHYFEILWQDLMSLVFHQERPLELH